MKASAKYNIWEQLPPEGYRRWVSTPFPEKARVFEQELLKMVNMPYRGHILRCRHLYGHNFFHVERLKTEKRRFQGAQFVLTE
jgi:hypothetical protein